ncbi:MAG: AMIN domain-containing protein, partial [Rivularia sp. ALOHA_DT_140]|nr:AMIN domain-containing protein [Rivularia sp. ALOHA_DT_140]
MDKQFKDRHFVRKCKRLIRASLFGLYAAVAFNTNSSIAAPQGRLEDWRFYPRGSQLEISLSAPVKPQYFYLSQPSRIVVDLPDTKLGSVPTQQNYNGAIKRIRVSQLDEDTTRIVMDLAPGAFFDGNQAQFQPNSWQNPILWVFRPLINGYGNNLSPGYPSIGGELPPGTTGQLP